LIAKKLDKGGRVTALDVSPQWQEVARKRLREYDNIDFINSDIRSAGLKDGCFDVIVIDYVLHDIPRNSRMAIVLELGKKVKVGGLVQLREPTKERHGMPPEEIRSLMTSAGLKESSTLVKKNVFQAMYVKGQGVISYGER
jgi:2-polyprenyl-3-methyl-5-hydroxy-6-metoxy-1,4-benzoquinol methylase